jgi:hypothetical protein
MKKICLLLMGLMVVLTIIPARAQRGERFGIRAGYQSSAQYKNGSQVSDTDPLNYFYAGLFRDNKIIPALYLGVGVEYFQNGHTYNNGSDKWVLNYLSIPVYLKAKLGPVFALGGLGANFKLSEKIYFNGESMDPPDGHGSKTMDVPVFLGAGVRLSIFTIEARYHWGLVDINNGNSNQYFQIGGAISL